MLLKSGLIIGVIANHPKNMLVEFNAGNIVSNKDVEPSMKLVRKADKITTNSGYSRLHLYLFVEEDACVGDFVLCEDGSDSIVQVEDVIKNAMRLIATTNTKYPIARLPKLFLNEYVEAGGIDRTMVVYEEKGEHLIPKINSRNIVSLGGVKDTYTGEEVSKLFDRFLDEVCEGQYKNNAKAWKEENI
jgi:hypothetical protein